jgi:hypothetical protein
MLGSLAEYHHSADSTELQHFDLQDVLCELRPHVATHRFLSRSRYSAFKTRIRVLRMGPPLRVPSAVGIDFQTVWPRIACY